MPVGGVESVSPIRMGVTENLSRIASQIQESLEQRVGPSSDKVDPPKAGVEVSISPEAMCSA